MRLEVCPRCRCCKIDRDDDFARSNLKGANHTLCIPCYLDEDQEIMAACTNDLPNILANYGPSNNLSNRKQKAAE